MMKTKMSPQNFKKGKDTFFTAVVKKQDLSSKTNHKPHNFFISSSSSASKRDDNQLAEKKVFDKNKWRVQKYSLKNRVEKWHNKRTENIRQEYLKGQKRTNKSMKFDVQKIYDEDERRGKEKNQEEANFVENKHSLEEFSEQSPKKSGSRKRKRRSEIRNEKEAAKEQFLKMKAEKVIAMEHYRKKKLEKHRKLDKKTKRGQPVMKGRMELLLEKIQENLNS